MKKAIALLAVWTGLALGADTTGTWAGAMQLTGPNGNSYPVPAYLILKQTDSTLTGSGGSEQAQQFPLEKGEVSGDTVRFQVTFGPTVHFDLHRDGDSMTGKVTIDVPGGATQEGTVSLKRQ
jgi:hypothetical protein